TVPPTTESYTLSLHDALPILWRCDFYRAGDGVHRAWLDRRQCYEAAFEGWFRKARSKHRELLALEERMFTPEATGMIIANSQMRSEEHTSELQSRGHLVCRLL